MDYWRRWRVGLASVLVILVVFGGWYLLFKEVPPPPIDLVETDRDMIWEQTQCPEDREGVVICRSYDEAAGVWCWVGPGTYEVSISCLPCGDTFLGCPQ